MPALRINYSLLSLGQFSELVCGSLVPTCQIRVGLPLPSLGLLPTSGSLPPGASSEAYMKSAAAVPNCAAPDRQRAPPPVTASILRPTHA